MGVAIVIETWVAVVAFGEDTSTGAAAAVAAAVQTADAVSVDKSVGVVNAMRPGVQLDTARDPETSVAGGDNSQHFADRDRRREL